MAPKKDVKSSLKQNSTSKTKDIQKNSQTVKKGKEELTKTTGVQSVKGSKLNIQQPVKNNVEEQKIPLVVKDQTGFNQSQSKNKQQPVKNVQDQQEIKQAVQSQKGSIQVDKNNQESENKNDQQIKELQQENKTLKSNVQDLEQKLQDCSNNANKEVNELKQQIKDKDDIIQKFKQSLEKLQNEKKNQPQKLIQQQKEEENKIQKIKGQKEKIQKELENQITLNRKQEQEKNEIKNRNEQLEKQVNDLQQNLKEKDQEIVNLKLEINQKPPMSNTENEKILNSSSQGPKSQDLNNQAPIQLKQIYPRRALTNLKEEFQHNENIKQIIDQLCLKFNAYRNVRGDGNCYFRAVGFSFLEHLVRITTLNQHLIDLINNFESQKGYFQVRPGTEDNQQKHANIRQIFLGLLKNLLMRKQEKDTNILQYLEQELQNNKDNQDEALIWEMRSITANYLECHKEYFQPFCQISYEKLIQNVLEMGKEADGIGIGPLQVVLKVKIEIVTIGRQYAEALSFEQMKVDGTFPQIFILYKPGHYDILYTKEQSNADGFKESTQEFSEERKPPQNYDIDNPGPPFFVKVEKNGQECPYESFKEFRIEYIIDYIGTEQNSQLQQSDKLQDLSKQPQVQQCTLCQQEIDIQDFIQLLCHHQGCKYCLEDWVNVKSGGKIVPKNQQGGNKVVCKQCNHILEDEEIEKILGKEKYRAAINKSKGMQELIQKLIQKFLIYNQVTIIHAYTNKFNLYI